MERLITVSDAAQRLGVTKKTLQVWDNDGKLTALRTAGGHRRYRQSDVDKLSKIVNKSKPLPVEEAKSNDDNAGTQFEYIIPSLFLHVAGSAGMW